jgi:hypothetical protein
MGQLTALRNNEHVLCIFQSVYAMPRYESLIGVFKMYGIDSYAILYETLASVNKPSVLDANNEYAYGNTSDARIQIIRTWADGFTQVLWAYIIQCMLVFEAIWGRIVLILLVVAATGLVFTIVLNIWEIALILSGLKKILNMATVEK